jgi:glycine cleavage system H lipoate-binding protein
MEGTVQEVNDKLNKNPKLINTSPLSQGWYAKLKVDTTKSKVRIDNLMSEDAYNKYVQDLKK